jgi:hypothetical protein
MTTDFFTPYMDGITQFKSAHMNAPLEELDAAIGTMSVSVEAQSAGGVGLSFEATAKPTASGSYSFLLPYEMTVSADCAGSAFYNATNPTAQVVVSIKCDGTEIATLTVATNGTPTWSSAGATIPVGSRVSFVFHQAQDATWAGVAITLQGVRTIS